MQMEEGRDAPAHFWSLREEMVRRRDDLPKRLAQVAAYAIANPDDVAFGTAASIADKASVQPSTLVRFTQAFGYHGFSQLQEVFRDRLRDRPQSYSARLDALRAHSAGDGAESETAALFAGFCDAAERSVQTLRERVSPGDIDAAAALLARAETIYLIAQRRSFPISTYMSYAFGKLGIRTVLVARRREPTRRRSPLPGRATLPSPSPSRPMPPRRWPSPARSPTRTCRSSSSPTARSARSFRAAACGSRSWRRTSRASVRSPRPWHLR